MSAVTRALVVTTIGVGAVMVAVALATAVPPAAPQSRSPDLDAGALEQARATGRVRLRELVARGDSPGMAAAVSIDGAIVWAEGFGVANLEHGVPVSDRTRFGLGSLSKTITAIGLLSLVDRGRIDLDAPIERYLPDFPHAGSGITLRRLAAHQSGLSDRFATENNWTHEHYDDLDAAYRRIRDDPVVDEPGAKASYATGTYTLIGRAMERAAGKPYFDIITEAVVTPSGAHGVAPNDRKAVLPDRTSFYEASAGGGFEHGPYFDPSFKLPGAGLVGSASDVARIGGALLTGVLLSPAAQAEMFQPVALRDGAPSEYALGLRVGDHRGRRVLHLPGGGIGIAAWIYLYPRERLAMTVLSNVSTGSVGGKTHDVIASAFLQAAGR